MLQVIKDTWDTFDEHGMGHSIIGYKFCIGASASSLVYYQFPQYDIHESKVMKDQILALENNK